MQRKKCAGFVAAVFMIVCMTGCAQNEEVLHVTNLRIEETGTVTHTMIEAFDTSVYDVTELQTMIQEEIAGYEKESGTGKVSLVSAEMSDTEPDKIVVSMEFSDTAAYCGFNETDMFFGTIAEAVEKGYALEKLIFTDVKDETKTYAGSELLTHTGHILIIRENMPVSLPYKILYTSGHAELLDKYTTAVPDTAETDGFYYVITK